MATSPRKKPAARPTSNATLVRRMDELDERVKALEDMVEAAKQRQQQMAAQQLAQNPEQLAQLRTVLDMAAKATPAAAKRAAAR